MNYKILFFLSILLMANSTLYAAPTITSYSNRVITCTGAGSKSTAGPIKFDNMETGSVGSELTISGWSSNASGGAIYNADQAYSGNLAAYNYVETDSGGTEIGRDNFATSWLEFTETDVVYLSFYFRFSKTLGECYGQGKNCRISGPGADSDVAHYRGPGTMKMSDLNARVGDFYPNNAYDPGDGNTDIGDINLVLHKQWQKFEYTYELSTAGSSDGESSIILVGIQNLINKDIMTRNTGETFKLDSVLLGLMYANLGKEGTNPSKMEMWIDDVFIDITRQRVVIGDNPVFASCTKRDDQSATVWSDTSITIGSLNVPSFNDGETAYLFVVDSDGTASDGYEIIVNSLPVSPGINGAVTIKGAVTITP